MSRWKTALFNVYKALKESAKSGRRELTVLQLSLITGYSPVYLRNHLLPALVQLYPECIKLERGKVVYTCEEGSQ